jgi:hypothetical protein
MENGYTDDFHCKCRKECPNEHSLLTLTMRRNPLKAAKSITIRCAHTVR